VIRPLVCLAAALGAWAQTPQELAAEKQRESVLRQQESLARSEPSFQTQREAARKHAASAVPAHEFYAVPWKSPSVMAVPPLSASACLPLSPLEMSPAIQSAASRYSLEPGLLQRVITRESAWQPCAVSRAGAQGLMQIMPATAQYLGLEDPFDPLANLDAGSRYLRELLTRYGGDLSLALGAYNAGPGRVDAAGGVPPIPETQSYVRAILGQSP
jgi:soluble lytic murein transglycosylase-like protein